MSRRGGVNQVYIQKFMKCDKFDPALFWKSKTTVLRCGASKHQLNGGICLEGYQDALQFLRLSGLIQCKECKTLTKEDYKTLTKEDCAKCKELEKQAEDSKLPESLRQVFQEARQSEATTSSFLSWLIQQIRSSLAWLLTLSY